MKLNYPLRLLLGALRIERGILKEPISTNGEKARAKKLIPELIKAIEKLKSK